MKLVNCHHIRKRRRRRRRRTQTEFSQQQQVEATTTTRETITTTESAQVTNTNTTNSIDRLCYRSANLLKTLVNNNEDSNSNNNSINYDLVRLDQCDLKPIINNCYCSSARPQVCRSHRKHRQTLDIDTNKFNSLTKSKGRFTINFKLLYLAIMCLITLNDNVDFVVDKMGALTRSLSLGSETTSFDKLVCYHWPSQLTLVANKQAIATTTTSQSNCSNDRTICTTFAQDGFCTIMTTSSQKDQERPRPRPTRTSLVQFANADSDANRLYEDLMMPYNRIVRPVQNTSDRVVVRIGLKLSQLMEVAALKDEAEAHSGLGLSWTFDFIERRSSTELLSTPDESASKRRIPKEWSDYKLKWDPSEYGGIKDINLPAEQIWLPDIVLYNSAEGYFAVSIFTKAKVRYDGYVVWNPPAIFRSSCQIDITYFPFDSQNCHLKFGSWTFGAKLDLRHINDTEGDIERGTDLSEYYQNVEWDIMKATARRNTIVYDCCPDDIYPDVTFNFSLRRKPLFYTVNLILPCVGITFFSFLVFYLPSDSGEKVTLTISILVSLIFFLSVLIETIPSTSLAMPLLGKYLVFSMILITLSVCATVCVLNIHFRSPSTHSMPAWIKRWCMDILPKYLLMSVPQYQSQQSNILPENLVYLHNQAYANQVVTLPKQPSKGNNKSLSSQQEATAAQTTEVKMPLVDSSSNLANNNNTDQQLEGKQHKNIASKTSVKSRDSGANKSANKPSANRSDARPLELDVANLANGANVFQTRPSTFLPYLHSEAARRLQMQRSRSSERDNKSASDNQQASGTSTSEEHSSQRLKNIAANNAQINVASTSGAGAASSSTRASDAEGNRERGPGSRRTFWRFFRRNKSDSDQAATEQDQQQSTARKNSNTRQHHEHQQIINICRPTHGASSSSSSSSSDDMDNIADEYMHHRHFQARASICSNNLWRIGPTRRCSLTTQANYPTYYRPLTQLQLPIQHAPGQSTSGCGQQQVALAQRPGVGHYHVHADDSVGSSLSTDTYNYQSGATVVSLITATASNLLRPRQLFDSNCQEARCREEREMQPLTSGGFIQNGAQLPHAVGAVPPRQLDTPSSYQSESQHNIPTPPPPLPPEFGDSPPQSAQYSSQHNQVPNSNYAHMDNQQSFVSVNNNSSSSSNRHYQMNKNIMNNSSRQQSNSMLTGNQKVAPTTSGSYHGGYADQYGSTSFVPPAMNQQHINANQHTYFTGNKVLIGGDAQGGSQGQHRQQRVPLAMMANFDSVNLNSPGQQQQQQRQQQNFCEPRFGTGTSASSGSGGSSRLSKNPSMTKEQSTRYLNYGAYGIGGQAMPRSRSTGQQLSSMGALSWQASNSSGTTTGKQVEQTNGPIYQIAVQRHTDPNQQPLMTHGNISNHSIGRQLGQAYIQKLQRQPTVWSLNLNRSLPLAPHPAGAATQLPFPASSCRQTQANGLLAPDASDGRTLRSVQSSGKGHLLPGQYHEPTIDMLRRSKSQTSLSRDKSVHGALNQINDCQHCRAAGANEYRNNRTLDNNNCNLISGSRFAHRPQSEMRGRFNSTGCRFNNLQQQEQSMLRSSNYSGQYNCDDETGEVFHCAGSCAPAMATVAPDDRMLPARQSSKNKSHDKDDGPGFDRAGDGACRCSALERPHSAARSQSNGHQQLSSLSMLKLISEVDKAIQNAMFIAQHIDNLDEFESVSLATR